MILIVVGSEDIMGMDSLVGLVISGGDIVVEVKMSWRVKIGGIHVYICLM